MIPHTRMNLRHALSMAAVDFSPFVVYFLCYCLVPGSLLLVLAIALMVSAAVLTRKYVLFRRAAVKNWPKTFDVATLAVFFINIVFIFWIGPALVKTWFNVSTFAILDVACWATCCTSRPFMAEYAQEFAAKHHWSDPVFMQSCRRVSELWSLMILLMAISCCFTPFAAREVPDGKALQRALTLDWIIPLALFLLGLGIQFFYGAYIVPPLSSAVSAGKSEPLIAVQAPGGNAAQQPQAGLGGVVRSVGRHYGAV